MCEVKRGDGWANEEQTKKKIGKVHFEGHYRGSTLSPVPKRRK
jgi:hypothetical protein